MEDREELTSDDHQEPLSPTARLFHATKFNCHIVAIMGFKTTMDPAVIRAGLEHTLLRHPRFSSKLMVRFICFCLMYLLLLPSFVATYVPRSFSPPLLFVQFCGLPPLDS
uniref:Uncharacterized protein n=1 Tax=Rhizophora mucronata TaxID=61149 RepID=A0A2P2IYN7_RHIMU